jgi:ferrous iron transport protein A
MSAAGHQRGTASAIALTELANGQRGVIVRVRATQPPADDATVQRLGELGFLPGEPVRLMRRGPGGREPIAVQVGDTLFALRHAEARCVEVEPEARA